MKRLIPLLLCVLLLAGCRSIYPEEYLYLETHEALYAYQGTASAATEPEETEEPPLRPVSYLSYIRVLLYSMLSPLLNSIESGNCIVTVQLFNSSTVLFN